MSCGTRKKRSDTRAQQGPGKGQCHAETLRGVQGTANRISDIDDEKGESEVIQ